MKGLKRIISAVMSVVMLSTAIDLFTPVTVSAAVLQVGEYLQMGTYYDEPILWRCTAYYKITGYDDNGNPIVDAMEKSTEPKDGYLPLMVSDKILCLKPFDAAGENTSGSHGRGYVNDNTAGYWRRQRGSNYWGDSNIRDWLNSDASAGNVVWSCGNPPDKDHVYNGYNAYDQEAGFLNGFTSGEKSAMLTVTQKQLLDGYEYSSSRNENYYRFNASISDVLQNYDTAYSETTTDKVFLLDVKQVYDLYNDFGDYFKAYCTSKAVENSENSSSYISTTGYGFYWLRSPGAYYGSNSVRYVIPSGYVGDGYANNYSAYNYSVGVRPAFYLNLKSVILSGGSGSETDPYVLNGNGSGGSEDEKGKLAVTAAQSNDNDTLIEDSNTGEQIQKLTITAAINARNNDCKNVWIAVTEEGSPLKDSDKVYLGDISKDTTVTRGFRITLPVEENAYTKDYTVHYGADNSNTGAVNVTVRTTFIKGKPTGSYFEESEKWKFVHTGFGDYKIRDDKYSKLKDKVYHSLGIVEWMMLNWKYFDSLKEWGGSCYGMSLAALLFKSKQLDVSKTGASCVNDLDFDDRSKSLINYYYLLQDLTPWSDYKTKELKKDQSTKTKELITKAQNYTNGSGELILIGLQYYSYEKDDNYNFVYDQDGNKIEDGPHGHAIISDGIEYSGAMKTYDYTSKEGSFSYDTVVHTYDINTSTAINDNRGGDYNDHRKTKKQAEKMYIYINSQSGEFIIPKYSDSENYAGDTLKIKYACNNCDEMFDKYNYFSYTDIDLYANEEPQVYVPEFNYLIITSKDFAISDGKNTYTKEQIINEQAPGYVYVCGDHDELDGMSEDHFFHKIALPDKNTKYTVIPINADKTVEMLARYDDCLIKVTAEDCENVTFIPEGEAEVQAAGKSDVDVYKETDNIEDIDDPVVLDPDKTYIKATVNGGFRITKDKIGKTVNIDFDLIQNPGIASYTFNLCYDPNIIRAKSLYEPENGDFTGYVTSLGKPIYMCPEDDLGYSVNDQINYVPSSVGYGEETIYPNADGIKTAAELGKIRLIWVSTEWIEKNNGKWLEDVRGDGRLITLTFDVLAEGDPKLTVEGSMAHAPQYNLDLPNPDYEFYPKGVIVGGNEPEFIYGDADGNGSITAGDAALVLQKTLLSTFEIPLQNKTDDWLKYVDVDANKEITAGDSAYILQKTLLSTFELPAEKENQ